MLNHVHLIINSPDVYGFIRDFKRHTTRELKTYITKNKPQILAIFYSQNSKFHIWKKSNHPIFVEYYHSFHDILDYIHNNPVIKGYTDTPEE